MEFKDLEAIRKEYSSKSQSVSKKRKKYILITCAIIYSVELILFAIYCLTERRILLSSPLLLLFFLVVAGAVQLAFISIFVLLATYKDSTTLNELQLNYKKAYKGCLIQKQLAKFFTNLEYDHSKGLDESILKDTKLIYTGDIYRSNDLVKAKYKNTNFTQADVHILREEKHTDSEGHTRTTYVTVFKGRYLIFEFPKKFNYKMTVSFHGHGASYINPKTGRGLSRIETESPTFNKHFLVYAEDGFEAFYILTPDFMEKLEQLGEKYKNALSLYFSDNKMIVGLNDHNDAFEPPADLSKPINKKEEEQKVIKDMSLITELVDNLKLSK